MVVQVIPDAENGCNRLQARLLFMSGEQYFGENGPFAHACDEYRDRFVPTLSLLPDELLDRPACRGFLLGWCFASVLAEQSMLIGDDDLKRVAVKVERPVAFINGFRLLESQVSQNPVYSAWH